MWKNKTTKTKLRLSSLFFFVGSLLGIGVLSLVVFNNHDESFLAGIFAVYAFVGVIGPCLLISAMLFIVSLFIKSQPVTIVTNPYNVSTINIGTSQTNTPYSYSLFKPPLGRLLSSQTKLNVAYAVCTVALVVRMGFIVGAHVGFNYNAGGVNIGVFLFLASLDVLSYVLFFATALVGITGLLTSSNRYKIVPGLLFLAFVALFLMRV